jgi:hypothetical protein
MSGSPPSGPSGPTGSVSSLGPTGTANQDVGVAAPNEYNPVRVNLEAVIDISGNVQIFTTASTTVSNLVICTARLVATNLFNDVSNGVFEFTEPSGNRGDVSGFVSNGSSNGSILGGLFAGPGSPAVGSGMINIADLATGIHACLTNSLDASGANPFNRYASLTSNEYTTYASLGELVLSLYAAYLFGHPAATAGITNDNNLITYINSAADGANVGTNLATAINNLTNAQATNIVRSVLSQDPNRAVNAPNRQFNALNGQHHVPLIFRTNDVVYVSVTVQAPTVTTLDASGAPSNSAAGNLVGIAANAASNYPASRPNFAFQITLS